MRGPAVYLLAAAVLLAACGSPPAAVPTPAPIPRGFTLTTDAGLGFRIALAPGWTQSARDPQSGVVYAGPGGAETLVHVEQASSPRLDLAAIPLVAELTGGDGLAGAATSPARLAGQTAERTAGRFSMSGQALALAAYVMVEGPRVWAVALVGPSSVVGGLTPAWERMAATFALAGARPRPPARLAVGLPAPGFAALDRTSGPVVVTFFATWCADCRTDMPEIAAAARRDGRFTLIAVDCCGDQGAAVPAFLAGLGVQGQFRNVVRDDDGAIARSYALLGPPTTAFLDRHRVLRRIVVGPITTSSLTQGLAAIGAS